MGKQEKAETWRSVQKRSFEVTFEGEKAEDNKPQPRARQQDDENPATSAHGSCEPRTGMICRIREMRGRDPPRRPSESDGETEVYPDQLEANHGSILE